MTTSQMVAVDDGHAHSATSLPKIWCDIGGTALFAQDIAFDPFFGGTTAPVGYTVGVGITIQAMCGYVDHSTGSPRHGVMLLAAGAASDLFVPFIGGLLLAPLG